jgi:hypothetical protein
MKKIEGKKYLGAPTPPEDEAICLFAGLLANPDMPLSLTEYFIVLVHDIFDRGFVHKRTKVQCSRQQSCWQSGVGTEHLPNCFPLQQCLVHNNR